MQIRTTMGNANYDANYNVFQIMHLYSDLQKLIKLKAKFMLRYLNNQPKCLEGCNGESGIRPCYSPLSMFIHH